ncbi:MAG: BrnA antitoxin family protein [Telluria sp.]
MQTDQTFAPANVFAAAAPRPTRPVKRKTRITIYLDDEILAQFRNAAQQTGKGYQTLINAALRHRLALAAATE